MLVLTRRVGEEIVIGHSIRVTILAVQGNKVRIGVQAPDSIRVDRAEVHDCRSQLGAELERIGSGRHPDVAGWIDQRTGARVHRLRVERANGKMLIHGRTGSHHVRQLALAAALELMQPEEIEVRIEVRGAPD